MTSRPSLVALLLSGLVAALFPISSSAAPNGPNVDARGDFDPGDLDTSWYGCLIPGACGFSGEPTGPFVTSGNDKVKVNGSPVSAGAGFLYTDWNIGDLNMTLTTFYGLDLNPLAADDAFIMGGVDSVVPQFDMSDETFIGNTQEYPADALGSFSIAELDAEPLFSGFDLSRFGGDPTALVYAFRATVPVDEFMPVPEPATLLLLGVGALGVTLFGKLRSNSSRKRG